MAVAQADAATLAEQFGELRRGWPVVLSGACVIAISMPTIGTYGLTFFIGSWQREFGWTREEAGIAASCLTLTIFLTAPIVGRLCDRFGVRAVACTSIPLFALALLAMSRMGGALWQLYIGYVVLAAFGAGAGHVCYLRTIATWFDKGRGMALGMAGAGAGIAAAIAPSVLSPWIAAHGWRDGWILLAGVTLVALPIVWLALREHVPPAGHDGTRTFGMSAHDARRTPTFWFLLCGTAALGVGLVGLSVQLVPLVTQATGSAAIAGRAATTFGLSIVAGRLCTGFLLDRYRPHVVAGVIAAVPALGIIAFAADPAVGSIAFAIGLGLAGGAEHDIIGFIVARAFGLRSFSEIFGWMFGALALGAAIGPLVIRLLKYLDLGATAPLLTSALLCVTAAVLFFQLGRGLDTARAEP